MLMLDSVLPPLGIVQFRMGVRMHARAEVTTLKVGRPCKIKWGLPMPDRSMAAP